MWIVWVFAVLFLCDSVTRLLHGTFNFGTLCMYLITAALWLYAFFHVRIHAFCAHGFGYALKIAFFCGLAVLCLLIFFIALAGRASPPDGTEKAMIVLGAGLRGEVPSGLLTRRMNAAYDYFMQHPNILVVVSGGQGRFETIPEADAMRKYLLDKGVPASQILTEPNSTSTAENFIFSKKLLTEKGIVESDGVVFVTNAFHCYRAKEIARRVGYANVRALPASIGLSSILPCYLREAAALIYFWAFGCKTSFNNPNGF